LDPRPWEADMNARSNSGSNSIDSKLPAMSRAIGPLFAAAICLVIVSPQTAASAEGRPAKRSVRIINVVDDFLAYHKACAQADAATRTAKWKTMLEDRHPRFFADVIYRKLEGAALGGHKKWCFDEFWKTVAPRISDLAKVNRGIEKRILAVLKQFRKQFPDFQAETDFYVTVAFSFKGKVDTIRTGPTRGPDGKTEKAEKKIFALALEQFLSGGPDVEITIAHEMFHLYHFQTFSTKGAIYRMLWAEGLASYASAVVVGGHRLTAYLGFDGKKVDLCHKMLPVLAADLKKYMGQTDRRRRRVYFGAEANYTKVPPEAGYYVGFLMVSSLARTHTMKDLARMPSKHVYKIVASELDRLAKVKP